MKKVVKELINSSNLVIDSEVICYADIEDIGGIINSLAKLVNALNTRMSLINSSNIYRIRIEDIPVLTDEYIKSYVRDSITETIKDANRLINHINDSSAIMAKRRNDNGYRAIKNLKVDDYLYPLRIIVRAEELGRELYIY